MKMIKQILTSLLGNCVLGCGLALGAQAQLGLDPCVSFSQSIANITGYKIGTIITCVNIVLVIIVLVLEKKNIGLTTLFVVFLNKYPVDFFTELVSHSDSLIINIILVTLGTVLVGLGCNIMINAHLGMGIYDALIFSISNKVKKEYVIVRYVVDATFLILTFIFKGYIGIGTIIAYFVTGNVIKYSRPFINRIIRN